MWGGNMARKKSTKQRKKNSFSKSLNTLAYNMGLVKKGLKNENSQVSASYNRGLNHTTKKSKPLY